MKQKFNGLRKVAIRPKTKELTLRIGE